MTTPRKLTLALALTLALGGPLVFSPLRAAEPTAAINKDGWYHKLVKIDVVEKVATVPKPAGVMLIDSRPTTRKYDIGHIPTAINIPDSQFEKMTDLLPADKSTQLIFYCEGYECKLSHTSAAKTEKLGYTNVQVYAEGFPEWAATGHLVAVSVPYIKKLIDEKAPMMLIDARPKARKYDLGHIPGAVSLPDSQFEKMAPEVLPADKNAALYFYCEGLECKLSNDSAAKAVKMGYKNVKVVPEGYPQWVKLYGAGPTAGAASPSSSKPAIEQGKESGTITVASFERIFKEAPDTILLIDVREPKEFESGAFKGARNIHINTLEKRIDELPTDKPIVFVCGAGSRSGEAHDMAKLLKPQLKTYFMDAEIKWAKDGTYTIKQK